MSKKQRDKMINEFVDKTMAPLRDKLKALDKQLHSSTSSSEREKLATQIKALRFYETTVVSEIRTLHMDYPKSTDVKRVFDNCLEEAANTTKKLKDSRGLVDIIVDTIKDMANFCIRVLSGGKTPQFFDTTTKPVDSLQRDAKEIKQNLDQFVENVGEIRGAPGGPGVSNA